MVQQLNEPVSVISFYNHTRKRVGLTKIIWNKREYVVTKIGLHHTYRKGATLYHVFSVIADGLFFRLLLNSESLQWLVEYVSDGET